jgi:SAM-dependent methyltransferase
MEARERLYHMIVGYRATQAIRAAALLGICDVLAEGQLAAAEAAVRVEADPGLVQRLMRLLAALGVLAESADGRFANTEMGDLLRTDVAGTLRTAVIGLCQDSSWSAWGALPRGIRGEGVPFELANGQPPWEEMRDNPEVAERFNAFMATQTETFLPQLLHHFDFSTARHVVDVGGGRGALLAGILRANPGVRGTICDLDSGLSGAGEYLEAQGVAGRVDLAAGSFFESVPAGADVYLLRHILHDWPDERAAEILAVCRRAMRPGARLLVIDTLLPERATDDPAPRIRFFYDLNMFVMFGARERTERELRIMVEEAGFTVDRVLPTEPTATVVATAAEARD